MMSHAVIVIFIDSQVVTDDGMGLSVSVLSIWIVEEGNVVCVTAGAALAVSEGRTKPDGGRLIPGSPRGRGRGGRPVEHNTKTVVGVF